MKGLKNIFLFLVVFVPQVQAKEIVVPTEKPEIKIEKDGTVIVTNENNTKTKNIVAKQEIDDIDDIIDKIEKEYKFTGNTTTEKKTQETNNKNYQFNGSTTSEKQSDINSQKSQIVSQKETVKLVTIDKPKEIIIQKENKINKTDDIQTQKTVETKKQEKTKINKNNITTAQNTANNKQQNKESQEIKNKIETAMEEQQIDSITTKTIKNTPSNTNIFIKEKNSTKQEIIPNSVKEVVKKEEVKQENKQQQEKAEKLERVVKKEEEYKVDYKFVGNTTSAQIQNDNNKSKEIKKEPKQEIKQQTKQEPKQIQKEIKKEKPVISVTKKEEQINKQQRTQQKIYKTELISGDIKEYNTKQNIKQENNNNTQKPKEKPIKQYPQKIVKSSNYIEQPSDNLNLIGKIEQNLLYNTSGQQKQKKDKIEIKKGGWSKEDLMEVKKDVKFKITTKSSNNIDLNVKESEKNNKITALKDKAYEAVNLKEYEIAIKLYKEILKLDNKDNFTKLSLATAYHILGQYTQAKPLYIELLPIFPNSEQLISNLLSIIIQESPYEAIYLLPSLAKKYANSAVIQAQTSVAFSSVERYKDAIQYIQKAIYLDPENIEYKYNLAVLYDITKQYDKAYKMYKNIYEKSKNEGVNIISITKIEERLKKLKRYL